MARAKSVAERGHSRATAIMFAAADLGPLVVMTTAITSSGVNVGAWWAAAVAAALPLVIRNAASGLYRRQAMRFWIPEIERLLRHGISGLLLAAAVWLVLARHPSVGHLFAWWSTWMATVFVTRWGASALFRAWGVGSSRIFLIGSGRETQVLIEEVRRWRGVEPVMLKCAENGSAIWEEGSISPPTLQPEDEVWVATSELSREHLPSVLQEWRDRQVEIRVFRNPLHSCFDLQDRVMVCGIELVSLHRRNATGLSLLFKRAFDAAFAGVVAVVTLPVWLGVSLAIKIDSLGPVFFRQRRVGHAGREFNMFKFRTMQVGDAYSNKPMTGSDPRITHVGKFLRRTGIDELPQVLNVLRGEMSFVGPRPEMPFKVAAYSSRERERLIALPGITGLWQLRVHRVLPIHHALEYDLYYIEHQSLLLDLVIIGATIVETVKGIFGKSIFDV